MSEDSDDDTPILSAEATRALKEFLESQNSYKSELIVSNGDKDLMKVNDLTEDWQLSQFWYDDDTARQLTEEIFDEIPSDGKVALIGCPSLYYFVKKQLSPSNTVKLLDIDDRFTAYKDDFLRYDYKLPLPPNVPANLEKSFDLVLLDPPFLSEECMNKCAETAHFIGKNKFIICTGAVMEVLVGKLFNATRTTFVPKHKNNLGNEFACFTNYRSNRFSMIERIGHGE